MKVRHQGALDTVTAAAWESLHKATLELAKPAALKQRLTDAYKRHLIDLPTHDLPSEVRKDLEALHQSMTHLRGQQGECPVVATVRKMSIGEADACAARIVALLDMLHRADLCAPSRSGGPSTRGGSDTGASRIPTLISLNRA
jgi:uncharacterized protein YecA (UPF0149 family)